MNRFTKSLLLSAAFSSALVGIALAQQSGGPGPRPGNTSVPSVFGRTGAVVAATNDYTFAQLASKPTTIAGYGITDALTPTNVVTVTNKSFDFSANTATKIPLTAFTNIGAVHTLLHGNAAGNPSFGAVDLATEISGQLTLANLPTISNNTVLGNVSGSSAVPASLTATQLTALLNAATTSLKGAVKPDGTTVTVDVDGTIHAPTSSLSLTVGAGLVASPTTITGTGSINPTVTLVTNASTTYTPAAADGNKEILNTNAGVVTVGFPSPSTSGMGSGFGSSYYFQSAAGGVLTGTFDASLTSITTYQGQEAWMFGDGTFDHIGLSLPIMPADYILGNFTGSTGYPTMAQMPNCANDGAHALVYPSGGHVWTCASITAGAVTSVSNSDSTITISPTTGAVVASLNLNHSNTWTAAQTNSTNGAASTPAYSLTGAPYTGGSTTTNYPLFYLNNGASQPTTFLAGGEFVGINAPSGFAGRAFDYHLNGGASLFNVAGSDGGIHTAGGIELSFGGTNTVGLQWNGGNRFVFSSSGSQFSSLIFSSNANGAQFPTSAATATVPTLVPNRGDGNTGWGGASGAISGIVASVEKIRLTGEGIQYKQATAPTVSGTGSPTIATGSTDEAGEATAGTSATSLVITFNLTHTNAPFCTVTPQTHNSSFDYTLSNTAITITQTAAAEKVNYRCSFP